MAKPGTAILRTKAIVALKSLGFTQQWGKLVGCNSRSVQKMAKDGSESWFLIQCRQHQSETDRYLVGIMVDSLKRVDYVALFFQGESKLPIIPAKFLLEILKKHEQLGDASYTGTRNEQWRVDIYVSDEQLSPQGSNGKRYSIGPYIQKVVTNLEL